MKTLEDELIAQRRAKMEQWAAAFPGSNPDRFETTSSLAQVCSAHGGTSTEDLATSGPMVRVAGRLMSLRKMGKLTFAHIASGGARLQVLFERQSDEEAYEKLSLLDVGDWVGVEGSLFRTKTGELTVRVSAFLPLRKCLRPLPEKWHGLADVEQRYRQRHLDLVMNPESVERFAARSRMTAAVREFMIGARLRGGGDPHAPPHRRAAPRPGPSRPTTTPWTASSSCASPRSSTSSASWWAACRGSSRSTATSGTRASTPSTTPSSP